MLHSTAYALPKSLGLPSHLQWWQHHRHHQPPPGRQQRMHLCQHARRIFAAVQHVEAKGNVEVGPATFRGGAVPHDGVRVVVGCMWGSEREFKTGRGVSGYRGVGGE